jgi:hypothetical protein
MVAILSLLLTFERGFAQISCEAKAPAQVAVGQPFTFSITLNKQPSKMSQVNFTNFDRLGGPNTSFFSNTVSSGGRTVVETNYTYSYTLAAQKEGTFTMPPITFLVDGAEVKSNQVTVKVSGKAAQNSAPANNNAAQPSAGGGGEIDKNEVFVRASASKTTPYEGEQVTINYKLYVGSSITGGFNVNKVDMPTQGDLWAYNIDNPNRNSNGVPEVLNGKRYLTYEIKANAVFPQRSGKITITPMDLDITVGVPYMRRMGWMTIQDIREVNLKLASNSIVLNVKELPKAGAPDPFDGVCGSLKMTSSLSRKELKANEATNYVITISGTGNLQHISTPTIAFSPDFDVSDPRITDNIYTSGSVNGSRTFEYVIIPRTDGKFTIPAVSYSYFDLGSLSYKTLTTESYDLTVSPGTASASVSGGGVNQKDIKILDKDIRYIKSGKSGLHKKKSDFFGTGWYWLLYSMPILLFLIFILLWHKELEKRRDVVGTKDRKANKVARKRLKNAKKFLDTLQKEAFYIEISQVLWGYMSDKFHIPLSQLSMESVEAKLIEKSLAEELIREFIATLELCEYSRFAPTGESDQMMADMYNKALLLITKIEK